MKNSKLIVIQNQEVKLVFVNTKLDLESIKEILIGAYVRNATKDRLKQKVS